ncbi:F-box domain-containing protein [Coprinopsis cinerea okayama7|uniref:F-box domain-containing protein n=1 Tax=Coprinopsis cinerea (strain Okayama-7 / 130 / ATCC MYA-4618 / FGSC 9003) TaxID=240176 RepID=A8N0F4_COPC7|nr:F-box domain-containing protein [Coprinopsis cinerea okayama7\|eukprot:XP_001828404.1 F-box domain-containing protein [Coprinopsis cinerea okayama7\
MKSWPSSHLHVTTVERLLKRKFFQLGLPDDIAHAARSDHGEADGAVQRKAVPLRKEYRRKHFQLFLEQEREKAANGPNPLHVREQTEMLDFCKRRIAHLGGLSARLDQTTEVYLDVCTKTGPPREHGDQVPESEKMSVAEVKDLVSETLTQYRHLQDMVLEELNHLQKPTPALLAIEAEMEEYATKVRACRSLTSKWRQFPNEIWTRIFESFVFSTPPPATSFSNATFLPPALLLCAVCKLWRAIATTSPVLWHLVHVHTFVFPDGSKDSDGMFIARQELAKTIVVLDRIKAYPWSLSLDVQHCWDAEAWGGLAPFGNAIHPPSPSHETHPDPRHQIRPSSLLQHPSFAHLARVRIKGVSFQSDVSSIVFASAKHVLLQCTASEYYHDWTWDVDTSPSKPFPRFPAATTMVLHCGTPLHPAGVNLEGCPWANLTHLAISPLEHQTCQSILRLAPSVERCYFWIRSRRDNDPPRDITEGLPPLPSGTVKSKVSELTSLHKNLFSIPITGLEFPDLKTLRVVIHGYPPDVFTWAPSNAAHFSSLRRLCMAGTGLFSVEEYIIPILSMTPQLSELMVLLKVDYKILFEWLTFDPNRPRLQHLRYLTVFYAFKDPTSSGFDCTRRYTMSALDELVAVIRSRSVQRDEVSPAQTPDPLVHARVWFQSGKLSSGCIKRLQTGLKPYPPGFSLEAKIMGDGVLKVPHVERTRHWDEGFMSCFDRANRSFISSYV